MRSELHVISERDLWAWAHAWTPLPHVAEMLMASIGRVVRKQRLTSFPEPRDVSHIVDCLTADYLAGAAWIDRVDEKGRHLKLLKCGSIERLLHEADKAMRRRLQGTPAPLDEGDEVTVAFLQGGHSVVGLMSPRALDVESRSMGHCVGHGAYDEPLERGTIEIYSLRSDRGQPLVTIEVALDNLVWDEADGDFRTRPIEDSRRTVEQVQGPGNGRPPSEHMDALRGFLEVSGWCGWEEWYRPEDPAMEGVRRRWDELRDRDGVALAGFVDKLLARSEEEEDGNGFQPR